MAALSHVIDGLLDRPHPTARLAATFPSVIQDLKLLHRYGFCATFGAIAASAAQRAEEQQR
jgi:hypothetical protein